MNKLKAITNFYKEIYSLPLLGPTPVFFTLIHVLVVILIALLVVILIALVII